MNNLKLLIKKEEENSKNNLLNDNNRYTKELFPIKEKKDIQTSTFISRNKISYNIDKIKSKYGIFTSDLNQKIDYNKIQILKNKYFSDKINNGEFSINNIDKFSINNKKKNKNRNLFRNSSLQFVKENNIIFKNFYKTFKNQKVNKLIKIMEL